MTDRVHGKKFVNEGDVPVLAYAALKTLDFNYTSSGVQSAALTHASIGADTTHLVARLIATTACWVSIGANPNATTGEGLLLGAFQELLLRIPVGDKVAAARDTADGTMQITILE